MGTKISIVIPTYKRVEQTLDTINLLFESEGIVGNLELEMIVADSSPDNELELALRKAFQNKKHEPLLKLGFATFFLNRTNVSGILNGGPIGNINQTGTYKIGCRFNKKVLIERIRKIAEHKGKIHVKCLDAIDLVKKIKPQVKNGNSIFYFDPPYYLKGESLYMNHYEKDDHRAVGEAIKNIKGIQWIVSYDDHPELRKIYSGFRRKTHELIHSARGPRIGKEIIFFSPELEIPQKIYA